MQYRRRVLQGFQSLVSYSWSHSLDNDSSDAFLLWAGAGASPGRDHGSSDFDLRHSADRRADLRTSGRPAGIGALAGRMGHRFAAARAQRLSDLGAAQ